MAHTLSKTADSQRVLKKHVAAIHIGAKLSLLQRKLVNSLLYNAYDQLMTEREHTISASLLCEMVGFDSNNSAYLKAALRGLMETVVEFDVLGDDGKNSWEAMTLLSYARIRDGVCTYKYERALAEKLFHPEIYSKINLSVLRDMQSTHSLVLYENCYRYVNIGHTPLWDVDVFRKLMSVDSMASYKQFKLLNRAIIQPAMKEVSQRSNIQLELETIRKGRMVTSLRFLITSNPQMSLIGMDPEDEVTQKRAYKALIDMGISKTLARAWVLEHTESYIFEKIDLAHEQSANGKIRSSKAGFLKSAIEENYHNEKAKKKETLAAVETIKQARKRLESELEDLKAAQKSVEAAYRSEVTAIIEEAFEQLLDDEKEAVISTFQASLTSDIYKNAFKKNGWKDRLVFPDVKIFWDERGLALPQAAPDSRKARIEEIEHELKQPASAA